MWAFFVVSWFLTSEVWKCHIWGAFIFIQTEWDLFSGSWSCWLGNPPQKYCGNFLFPRIFGMGRLQQKWIYELNSNGWLNILTTTIENPVLVDLKMLYSGVKSFIGKCGALQLKTQRVFFDQSTKCAFACKPVKVCRIRFALFFDNQNGLLLSCRLFVWIIASFIG